MSGNTKRISIPKELVLPKEIDEPVEIKPEDIDWDSSCKKADGDLVDTPLSAQGFSPFFTSSPVSPSLHINGLSSVPGSPVYFESEQRKEMYAAKKQRKEKRAVRKQNIYQTIKKNVKIQKNCILDKWSDDEFDIKPKKLRTNRGVRSHKYSDNIERNITLHFDTCDDEKPYDMWNSSMCQSVINELKSLGF